jgi:murein DD-endopeptidase MepM/ murein hydrolase activator NlpD
MLAVTLMVGFLAPLGLRHGTATAAASPRVTWAGPIPGTLPLIQRPPASAAESTQLAPLRTYLVQAADTLPAIADRNALSVDTLVQVNHLSSADSLMVGQSITLPPVDGSMVTVAPGERLGQIADQYRADPALVASINNLSSGGPLPNQLFVPAAALPGGAARVQPPARSADRRPLVHFQWPTTGTITQPFGPYHTGLDIANGVGTPVVSADGGRVRFAGWGDYGLYIQIDHGNGFSTVYGHLSQLQVAVGQDVRPGQPIGLMGSTGRSTGPHLHFEIREHEAPRDPLEFLR